LFEHTDVCFSSPDDFYFIIVHDLMAQCYVRETSVVPSIVFKIFDGPPLVADARLGEVLVEELRVVGVESCIIIPEKAISSSQP